jgi:hypothetical protein
MVLLNLIARWSPTDGDPAGYVAGAARCEPERDVCSSWDAGFRDVFDFIVERFPASPNGHPITVRRSPIHRRGGWDRDGICAYASRECDSEREKEEGEVGHRWCGMGGALAFKPTQSPDLSA